MHEKGAVGLADDEPITRCEVPAGAAVVLDLAVGLDRYDSALAEAVPHDACDRGGFRGRETFDGHDHSVPVATSNSYPSTHRLALALAFAPALSLALASALSHSLALAPALSLALASALSHSLALAPALSLSLSLARA
jgi:hypothetical protein